MAAVSGRAGLFTIKESFNPNLTDQVEATTRGQKSGALRLEFGKVRIPTAATTVASVKMTVNTGIMAIATPSKFVANPATFATSPFVSGTVSGLYSSIVAVNLLSGAFGVATSGCFLSAYLHIDVIHTGSFSGQASGMDINYLAVGY